MNAKLLIALAMPFFLGCHASSETNEQQRSAAELTTTCGLEEKQSRICEVSQISILGQPDQYHEKMVSMSSYLAVDNGRLVVYPSREQFLAGDRMSSIDLEADFEYLKNVSNKFAFKYVHVRGKFVSNTRIEEYSGRFGILAGATIAGPALLGVEDRSNLDPDIIVRREVN